MSDKSKNISKSEASGTFIGSKKKVEIDVCGDSWTFETGQIAKLAAGSVILRAGGTVVMANVTYGDPQEGFDGFPLVVDYVERSKLFI